MSKDFMQSKEMKSLQDRYAKGGLSADEFRTEAQKLRLKGADSFMQSGAVKHLQSAYADRRITADEFRTKMKKLRTLWDKNG